MQDLDREVIVAREEILPSETDVIESVKEEIFKRIIFALQLEATGLHEVNDLRMHQKIDFFEEVEKFEKNLIKQALTRTNGNQRAAAKLLNLNVTTLYSKIKLYKLKAYAEGSSNKNSTYPKSAPSNHSALRDGRS